MVIFSWIAQYCNGKIYILNDLHAGPSSIRVIGPSSMHEAECGPSSIQNMVELIDL